MEKRHNRKVSDLQKTQKPLEEILEQHKNDLDDLKSQYEQEREEFEAKLRNEQLMLLKSFEFEKSDIERYYKQVIEAREKEFKEDVEKIQNEHKREIEQMQTLENENNEMKLSLSKFRDTNNELVEKIQQLESNNARLREEMEKETRSKRDQVEKEQKSSEELKNNLDELTRSNIDLANQLENEQKKIEELLQRTNELESEHQDFLNIDKKKKIQGTLIAEGDMLATALDGIGPQMDIKDNERYADNNLRSSPKNQDDNDNAYDLHGQLSQDIEKEAQGDLQEYQVELKIFQRLLDCKETEIRHLKEERERENKQLKRSMQELKDAINAVLEEDETAEETLETLRSRQRAVKELVDQSSNDVECHKENVDEEKLQGQSVNRDTSVKKSSFTINANALNEIIQALDENGNQQLKEKLKVVKERILGSHELDMLAYQHEHEQEKNKYLKEITDMKETELEISENVWDAVFEKLGIGKEDRKENFQEILKTNLRSADKENKNDYPSKEHFDIEEQHANEELQKLQTEKDELEQSIVELEKHFNKDKKRLLKKMQIQHKEFVLSPEAEIIEALTKDKAILEEACTIERFNLGNLYYKEMQDELEELIELKQAEIEAEKVEIASKFNEDIKDLLKALASKDENEVELLKDKNNMIRKMLGLNRKNIDGEKNDQGEIDDLKCEADKIETILPLKKEIAELQRKRQEEQEANTENLGKAVRVIRDLLSQKANEQGDQKRRFSFASVSSRRDSIREDEGLRSRGSSPSKGGKDHKRSASKSPFSRPSEASSKMKEESHDENCDQSNEQMPNMYKKSINSKQELQEALETLIESAFAEEKQYESYASSGAISDFDSEPVTPKPESEDGVSDSGAESVDNECLSIKKADLDLALNMERFGLGRVYYNEYRESLQDAFEKVSKLKDKNELLENMLNDGVKSVVSRTCFGKISAIFIEAETQTSNVQDEESAQINKKADDNECLKISIPSYKEALRNSPDQAEENTNSDRTAKASDGLNKNSGTDTDSSFSPVCGKENILTYGAPANTTNAETQTDYFLDIPNNRQEDNLETAKMAGAGEGVNLEKPKVEETFRELIQPQQIRATESIPLLGSGIDELFDYFEQKVDKDKTIDEKEQEKLSQDVNKDITDQHKAKDDSKMKEKESEKEKVKDKEIQHDQDGKDEKLPEKEGDMVSIPDCKKTEDKIISEKAVENEDPAKLHVSVDSEEKGNGKQNKGLGPTPEEKQLEVDAEKGRNEGNGREIDRDQEDVKVDSTAEKDIGVELPLSQNGKQGDLQGKPLQALSDIDETNDKIKTGNKDYGDCIIDGTAKDLGQGYKKLKDHYNFLKTLVGKEFVNEVEALYEGKEREEPNDIGENDSLEELIAEERNISKEIQSLDNEINTIKAMRDSNIRDDERQLADKELNALKELAEITDVLKKEEDRDFIEHLKNEKLEVEKKLKEIERDLEENCEKIAEDEKTLLTLTAKKLDLEGEAASKAQKLDKIHKKLAKVRDCEDNCALNNDIENLKSQNAIIIDLLESRFKKPLQVDSQASRPTSELRREKVTKAYPQLSQNSSNLGNVIQDNVKKLPMHALDPKLQAVLHDMHEKDSMIEKLNKKIKEAHRERDRCIRMVGDQTDRLKPFLKKQQRLQEVLNRDIQDPKDEVGTSYDSAPLSEHTKENKRKYEEDYVQESENLPPYSQHKDHTEQVGTSSNKRPDPDVLDLDNLYREGYDIQDNLKKITDEMELLTHKTLKENVGHGEGKLFKHIQTLENKSANVATQIAEIQSGFENTREDYHKGDVQELLEQIAVHQANYSEILSILPEGFDTVSTNAQDAFGVACLKDDLEDELRNLDENIGHEESRFHEAVKYQREGTLPSKSKSKLHELVRNKNKYERDLALVSLEIEDALREEIKSQDLGGEMQKKRELQKRIEQIQHVMEREQFMAAEELSNSLMLKLNKKHELAKAIEKLIAFSEDEGTSDIPQQVYVVISSRCSTEKDYHMCEEMKDVETNIFEIATEIVHLHQEDKLTSDKVDDLVELIEKHKSLLQEPSAKTDRKCRALPSPMTVQELHTVKKNLQDTESRVNELKLAYNKDETETMQRLQNCIKVKQDIDKQIKVFREILDLTNEEKELKKRLKENRLKKELLDINEEVNKKEQSITRLMVNIDDIDSSLQILMDQVNNNVADETEIGNTLRGILEEAQTKLDEAESERQEIDTNQATAKNELKETIANLEDELEESREELEFVENELEALHVSLEKDDSLSPELIDTTALLYEKKSLKAYLLEISSKLEDDDDKSTQLKKDEIVSLRDRKREAENMLFDIQEKRSKLEVQLEDEEIQDAFDALLKEKMNLKDQRDDLLSKLSNASNLNRIAHTFKDEKNLSDDGKKYYAHVINDMICGPNTLIQLAEVNERVKDLFCQQNALIEEKNKRLTTSLGDELSKAILFPSGEEKHQSITFSPVMDRVKNKETMEGIVNDICSENEKLRGINDNISKDLEYLVSKIGRALTDSLLDPNEKVQQFTLGTGCIVLEEDGTIQEVLEEQKIYIERGEEALGKNLANIIMLPDEKNDLDEAFITIPKAVDIMKKNDENLETVLAAYEDKLERIEQENNALRSMLGVDLAQALLDIDDGGKYFRHLQGKSFERKPNAQETKPTVGEDQHDTNECHTSEPTLEIKNITNIKQKALPYDRVEEKDRITENKNVPSASAKDFIEQQNALRRDKMALDTRSDRTPLNEREKYDNDTVNKVANVHEEIPRCFHEESVPDSTGIGTDEKVPAASVIKEENDLFPQQGIQAPVLMTERGMTLGEIIKEYEKDLDTLKSRLGSGLYDSILSKPRESINGPGSTPLVGGELCNLILAEEMYDIKSMKETDFNFDSAANKDEEEHILQGNGSPKIPLVAGAGGKLIKSFSNDPAKQNALLPKEENTPSYSKSGNRNAFESLEQNIQNAEMTIQDVLERYQNDVTQLGEEIDALKGMLGEDLAKALSGLGVVKTYEPNSIEELEDKDELSLPEEKSRVKATHNLREPFENERSVENSNSQLTPARTTIASYMDRSRESLENDVNMISTPKLQNQAMQIENTMKTENQVPNFKQYELQDSLTRQTKETDPIQGLEVLVEDNEHFNTIELRKSEKELEKGTGKDSVEREQGKKKEQSLDGERSSKIPITGDDNKHLSQCRIGAPLTMAKDGVTLGEVVKGYEKDLDTLKSRLGPGLYDNLLSSSKPYNICAKCVLGKPLSENESKLIIPQNGTTGENEKADESVSISGFGSDKRKEDEKVKEVKVLQANEYNAQPNIPIKSYKDHRKGFQEPPDIINRPSNDGSGFSGISINTAIDGGRTVEDVLKAYGRKLEHLERENSALKSMLGSELVQELLQLNKGNECIHTCAVNQSLNDVLQRNEEDNYLVKDEDITKEKVEQELESEALSDIKTQADVLLENGTEKGLYHVDRNRTVKESMQKLQMGGQIEGHPESSKKFKESELRDENNETGKEQMSLTNSKFKRQGDDIDNNEIGESRTEWKAKGDKKKRPVEKISTGFIISEDKSQTQTKCGIEAPLRMARNRITLGEIVKGYEKDLHTLKARLGQGLYNFVIGANISSDDDDSSDLEAVHEDKLYVESQEQSKAIKSDKGCKLIDESLDYHNVNEGVEKGSIVQLQNANNSQEDDSSIINRNLLTESKRSQMTHGSDIRGKPDESVTDAKDMQNIKQMHMQREGTASTYKFIEKTRLKMTDDDNTIEEILRKYEDENSALKSMLGNDLAQALLDLCMENKHDTKATAHKSQNVDSEANEKDMSGSDDEITSTAFIQELENEALTPVMTEDPPLEGRKERSYYDKEKSRPLKRPKDTAQNASKVRDEKIEPKRDKRAISERKEEQRFAKDESDFDDCNFITDADDTSRKENERKVRRSEENDLTETAGVEHITKPLTLAHSNIEAPMLMAKTGTTLEDVVKGYEKIMNVLKSKLGPGLYESLVRARKSHNISDDDDDDVVEWALDWCQVCKPLSEQEGKLRRIDSKAIGHKIDDKRDDNMSEMGEGGGTLEEKLAAYEEELAHIHKENGAFKSVLGDDLAQSLLLLEKQRKRNLMPMFGETTDNQFKDKVMNITSIPTAEKTKRSSFQQGQNKGALSSTEDTSERDVGNMRRCRIPYHPSAILEKDKESGGYRETKITEHKEPSFENKIGDFSEQTTASSETVQTTEIVHLKDMSEEDVEKVFHGINAEIKNNEVEDFEGLPSPETRKAKHILEAPMQMAKTSMTLGEVIRDYENDLNILKSKLGPGLYDSIMKNANNQHKDNEAVEDKLLAEEVIYENNRNFDYREKQIEDIKIVGNGQEIIHALPDGKTKETTNKRFMKVRSDDSLELPKKDTRTTQTKLLTSAVLEIPEQSILTEDKTIEDLLSDYEDQLQHFSREIDALKSILGNDLAQALLEVGREGHLPSSATTGEQETRDPEAVTIDKQAEKDQSSAEASSEQDQFKTMNSMEKAEENAKCRAQQQPVQKSKKETDGNVHTLDAAANFHSLEVKIKQEERSGKAFNPTMSEEDKAPGRALEPTCSQESENEADDCTESAKHLVTKNENQLLSHCEIEAPVRMTRENITLGKILKEYENDLDTLKSKLGKGLYDLILDSRKSYKNDYDSEIHTASKKQITDQQKSNSKVLRDGRGKTLDNVLEDDKGNDGIKPEMPSRTDVFFPQDGKTGASEERTPDVVNANAMDTKPHLEISKQKLHEGMNLEDVIKEYTKELEALKSQIGTNLYECLSANAKGNDIPKDKLDQHTKQGDFDKVSLSSSPMDNSYAKSPLTRNDVDSLNTGYMLNEKVKGQKDTFNGTDTNAQEAERLNELNRTPRRKIVGGDSSEVPNLREPGEICMDNIKRYDGDEDDHEDQGSIESGEIIQLETDIGIKSTYDSDMLAPMKMKQQNKTLEKVVMGYESDLQTLEAKLGTELFKSILDIDENSLDHEMDTSVDTNVHENEKNSPEEQALNSVTQKQKPPSVLNGVLPEEIDNVKFSPKDKSKDQHQVGYVEYKFKHKANVLDMAALDQPAGRESEASVASKGASGRLRAIVFIKQPNSTLQEVIDNYENELDILKSKLGPSLTEKVLDSADRRYSAVEKYGKRDGGFDHSTTKETSKEITPYSDVNNGTDEIYQGNNSLGAELDDNELSSREKSGIADRKPLPPNTSKRDPEIDSDNRKTPLEMLEVMTLEEIMNSLEKDLEKLTSTLGEELTKRLLEEGDKKHSEKCHEHEGDDQIQEKPLKAIHEKESVPDLTILENDNSKPFEGLIVKSSKLINAEGNLASDLNGQPIPIDHCTKDDLKTWGKSEKPDNANREKTSGDFKDYKENHDTIINGPTISSKVTDSSHQPKNDEPVGKILAIDLMKEMDSPLQDIIQYYENDLSVLKNILGATLYDMILKKTRISEETTDDSTETYEFKRNDGLSVVSEQMNKETNGAKQNAKLRSTCEKRDLDEKPQNQNSQLDAEKRLYEDTNEAILKVPRKRNMDTDNAKGQNEEVIRKPSLDESDILESTLLPYLNDNGTTIETIIQELSEDLKSLHAKLGQNLARSLLAMKREWTKAPYDSQLRVASVSDEDTNDEIQKQKCISEQKNPKESSIEDKQKLESFKNDNEERFDLDKRLQVAKAISERGRSHEKDEDASILEANELEALTYIRENDRTLEDIIKNYEDKLDRYESALGPNLSKAILLNNALSADPRSVQKEEITNDEFKTEKNDQEMPEEKQKQNSENASDNDADETSRESETDEGRYMLTCEREDQYNIGDQIRHEPTVFISDEKTIEEMLIDHEREKQLFNSIQSGDRKTSSMNEVERLKSENDEMRNDLDKLDMKLGHTLFSMLTDHGTFDKESFPTLYTESESISDSIYVDSEECDNDKGTEEQTKSYTEDKNYCIKKALEKPIKLINNGKTVEDMMIEAEKDRDSLGNEIINDGAPISLDDITESYKTHVKHVEAGNNTICEEFALLDSKTGKRLSDPLRQKRPSTCEIDLSKVTTPDSKSLIEVSDSSPGEHKTSLDLEQTEDQFSKSDKFYETIETHEYIVNSSVEAPIIMQQLDQTLKDVISDYETQLKELLSNQEHLKAELHTSFFIQLSVGPKLFKELCNLNVQPVDREKGIELTEYEGDNKEKNEVNQDNYVKIELERTDFDAITNMVEEEKPLASILDGYQGKLNLIERENVSLKEALSCLSNDFDVGQMISNYENKIHTLEDANKEAQREFEEKHNELKSEINDLRDTLEKLAQTLRHDFLDDLMKQQDSENRIQALQKMDKEHKTLAEVVEEYEENMKRLEKEKAVLEQIARQEEDGRSMFDAINDYEEIIQNLRDANKILNKQINVLCTSLGPKLTEELTKISEVPDEETEKSLDQKSTNFLSAVNKMRESNITLEEVLRCYESENGKPSYPSSEFAQLKKQIGEGFAEDIIELNNKTLEELQEKDQRPIALLLMKRRNDDLSNIIKQYETYLLQYGVLDALQGESLASELERQFEGDVQIEPIIDEMAITTLSSGSGTLFQDDPMVTGSIPDSVKRKDDQVAIGTQSAAELQKQLEAERELKEKYQKDVKDLLNSIVKLKIQNANDDEEKEDIERRVKEEFEIGKENSELKEELAKLRSSNSNLKSNNEDVKNEMKRMTNELQRLENALDKMHKGLERNLNDENERPRRKIVELQKNNEVLGKEIENLKSLLKEKEENFTAEKNSLVEHSDQEKKDTIKELLQAKAEVELKLQEQLSLYHELEDESKQLRSRNENLKEQLDHAEESMKKELKKYQEQIMGLEIENNKVREEKKHEVELLSSKLDLEKSTYEKLKQDYDKILKKEKERMQEDFETDLNREKRRANKDLEEQIEDLARLKKRHKQELDQIQKMSDNEKNDLQIMFDRERQQLKKEFEEKLQKLQLGHEEELAKLREALEEEMINEKAELSVQFNQEKTELQAKIEKDIYGDEIQKNINLESDFQVTLNKVLKDHANEIENINREMKQAEENFKEQKYNMLLEFENERERDRQKQQKLNQDMESNIENMLKEIIKLKHQRKEMRHQHRIEKQNMGVLFDHERTEIKTRIEQSKHDLLIKLNEEHENELHHERDKYEEMLKERQEALSKSEATRKELEEKLHNEERKMEESKLNNAQTRPISPEVQKEIKIIKRKIEVEYEQKLDVEKQRFEETLQGLRREVGSLQEKRKIIQERVYNQEGGHAAEKHTTEKSIANYKMEVLAKLESEMAQRMSRERRPLEKEIKELQAENEELKHQRWEMKIQFRREKAIIEEKYEKEKESLEQSFNIEREEMRKRLEVTLQKQEKANKSSGIIMHGELPASPRIDNTVRMLQQENLSLVTQNARLEGDVEKLTEKLESIEGNFKDMVEYEKAKAERVKKIQDKIPRMGPFKEPPERPGPDYQPPSTSSHDDVIFHRLQEKDHQIHQLLETKRYYESVLGELCDEAGLFELDRNEVV